MKIRIGLLLVIVLTVSGCSNQNQDSNLVRTIISQTEISEDDKVVISLLHDYDDPGSLEWISRSVSAYSDKNPMVQFDIVAVSPDDYESVLQKRFASGTMPDLFFLRSHNDDPTLIEEGFVMELTEQPFARKNFVGGALEGVEYKDGIWAVPIDWNGYGVVYNKLVFRRAGIYQIPETYTEFLELLEMVDSAGDIPLAAGYADTYRMIEDLQVDLSQSSYFNNTDWRISIERNLYLWEDNFFKFSDALDRLADRLPYYDEAMYELNWNDAAEKVANNEAAMIMGDFQTVDIIRAYDQNVPLGMFIFPWSDDMSKNNFPLKVNGGLAANAKSEHSEHLLSILEHFSSVEIGNLTQTYKKSLSVIEGVEATSDPVYDELLAYIEKGRRTGFSKFRRGFMNPKLDQIYNESIIRFFYDETKDIEATVKQMDVETQKVILAE